MDNKTYLSGDTLVRTDKGYYNLKTIYNLPNKDKIKIAIPSTTKIEYVPIKELTKKECNTYKINTIFGTVTATSDHSLLVYDTDKKNTSMYSSMADNIIYKKISEIAIDPKRYYLASLNNDKKLSRIPTKDQKSILAALRFYEENIQKYSYDSYSPKLFHINKGFVEWIAKGLNYKLNNKITTFAKCNYYEMSNEYGYMIGNTNEECIESYNELSVFVSYMLNKCSSTFVIQNVTTETFEMLVNRMERLGLQPIPQNSDRYVPNLIYIGNKNRLNDIVKSYYTQERESFDYHIDNSIIPYNCIGISFVAAKQTSLDCYSLKLENNYDFFIKFEDGNKKNNISIISHGC